MDSPFKFLDAFGKSDRNMFFGRDKEIKELYQLLRKSNFVVVYGKSGVGKTSLIRCGLANEFDSSEMLMIEVKRKSNINDALNNALIDSLKINKEELSALDCCSLLKKVYNRYLRPVYLFFDQFEELFILGTTEEIKVFVETLRSIRATETPCVVVLILREEYLGALNDFRNEIPFLYDFTVRVTPMAEPEAIDVVEKMFGQLKNPKVKVEHQMVPFDFEPDMPKQIIKIVSDNSLFINLPHLQAYLDRLFKIAWETKQEKVTISHDLLSDIRVSKIGSVLNNLLDEQIKKANEKIGETSDAKIISFLKIFVTEKDTKQPLELERIKKRANALQLDDKQVDACLEIFTNALILRPLEANHYELSHDELAAKISLMRPSQKRAVPAIKGNPYKGLSSFTEREDDVVRFFGRTEATEKVLALINTQPLVVVTGASGTGKSSLIKAGIYPELKRKGFKFLEIIRPGEFPLVPLRQTIELLNVNINRSTGNDHQSFLILIDQYEELITRAKKESEAQDFNSALRTLIENPQKLILGYSSKHEIKIIITVRSDFEPQFKNNALARYWDAGRFVVPQMSSRELEQVIEGPAELAACEFDPITLIKVIAEEVAGRPSALPLVSFALAQMYDLAARAPGRLVITQEIYNQIGVFSALQTTADKLYNSLSEGEQKAMVMFMLRTVSLEGSEIASKKVRKSELSSHAPQVTTYVNKVTSELVRERLIVAGSDEYGEFYEPAHDALLKGWTTLWSWIKDFGKENILLRERLNVAIREWKEHKLSKDILWSDEGRASSLKLIIKQDNWFSEDEYEFASRSIDLREKIANRDTNRRNLIIASSTIAAVIFASIAIYAWRQRDAAFGSEKLAIAAQIEANKNAAQAAAQARKANSERARAETEKKTAEELKIRSDKQAKIAEKAKLDANKAEQNARIESQKADKAKIDAESERAKADEQRQIAIVEMNKAQKSKQVADSVARILKVKSDSLEGVNKAILLARDSVKKQGVLSEYLAANILTPWGPENSSFKSAAAKDYRKYLEDQKYPYNFNYYAPKLTIGSIGTFRNGEFQLVGHLDDYDIKANIGVSIGITEELPATKNNTSWKNIKPDSTIVEIVLGRNSLFTAFNGKTQVGFITNLDEITASILRLYNNNHWKPEWLIVTEAIHVDHALIIVGDAKTTTLSLHYDQPLQKNDFSEVAFDRLRVITNLNSYQLSVQGNSNVFFKALGIRPDYITSIKNSQQTSMLKALQETLQELK